MHQLQKHILHQLVLSGSCRYSQIKPKEVGGNLFMYHVRRLMADGLIEKSQNQYRLTAQGLQVVDGLSLKNMTPRIQPKIAVLLACQNQKGEWLLYRRRRQPFYGLVGFPYGKIHLGEPIATAANRELKEKTGLQCQLNHCGEVYLSIYKDDTLVSHSLFHIFSGQEPMGELHKESSIGTCFWSKFSGIDLTELIPGLTEIKKLIEERSTQRFFAEIIAKTN